MYAPFPLPQNPTTPQKHCGRKATDEIPECNQERPWSLSQARAQAAQGETRQSEMGAQVTDNVLRAIRAMPEIDCAGVAEILQALASKMAEPASGFGELDLLALDEACDFVCGEQT